MADNLSRHEQYATPLCWSELDENLRTRLAWLHHSLGRDVLPPVEVAEQFSNILGDLLLEYGLTTSSSYNGRHRPRRIETTLTALSTMKNHSRKYMKSDAGNFLNIVRAHNKVFHCYSRQTHE